MAELGIEKILDCKSENGQQFYKIRWACTWEPAENLQGCQQLVDDFWNKMNSFKMNQQIAETQRGPALNVKIEQLSQEDKSEVQKLLTRNSNNSFNPPSNMLNLAQL